MDAKEDSIICLKLLSSFMISIDKALIPKAIPIDNIMLIVFKKLCCFSLFIFVAAVSFIYVYF